MEKELYVNFLSLVSKKRVLRALTIRFHHDRVKILLMFFIKQRAALEKTALLIIQPLNHLIK